MAETSGAMNITAGIDLAQLNRDVQKMKAQLSEVGTHAAKEGQKLDGIAKKVAGSMAAMFSVAAAEQFGQKIFQVRSEFQQLEVAFKVLLKSEERAVKLMGELTNLAATTPFGLQEVSGTAKQLIAYGIAAEDVNETLTTLGNIASAVGAPLRDIAYLYGTTMVQGRMYTQDLRQFMGRGIALADKLAEHFGIATDQVQEYVTAGKVGAKEFKAAIDALGGAGGEYDGLMEEQSKTLQGQWSNLQDSLDMMLNEIGKTTQSAFGQAIGMAGKLVENYEKVGRAIAAIVATYGAYKAATMAVTALEAIRATGIGRLTKMEALHYGWLVITEKAQKLLNRTMLANPYVLIATAIVAAGAALVAYTRNAKSAADYTAELNETIESTGKVTQNDRLISEYETLKGKTQLTKDETARMNEALNTLASSFPEAVTKANEWGEALEIDAEKLKALNDEYKALQMERFTEQIRENQEALKEIERERKLVAAAKKAYDAGSDRLVYQGSVYSHGYLKRYGGAKGAETLLKLKDEYDQINANIRQAEKYVSILQGNYVEDPAVTEGTEEENAKTEKELRNSYNRRQRAKKAAEDLKKTKADLEIEIAEGEVEAMEEGYDKQRAAEALQYRKTVEQIEREKADMLKKMQEEEKQQWLSEDENRKEYDFKPTKTTLDRDVLEMYETLGMQAKEAYNRGLEQIQMDEEAFYAQFHKDEGDAIMAEIEAEEEARRAYLERYGNYEEKKKAIKERYRKEMMAEGLKDYDIKMLEKEMEEELDSLAQVYDEAYQKIFRDPSKMTKATILDTIELAKKKLLELDKEADPESFKALQEAINGLQNAYDNIDFAGWGSSWDEVLRKTVMISRYNDKIEKAKKDGDKAAEEEAAANLESTKDALKKNIAGAGATLFADSLMQAADAMKKIAEAAGDVQLSGMAEQMGAWAQNLTAAAQGAASGGWIGAIVGGVSDIISQTVQFFVSSKVSIEQTSKEVKDFRHQIEMLKYVVEDSDFSNIFGVDGLSMAQDALRKAAKAIEDYQAKMNELNSNTMTTLYEKEKQAHSLGAAIMLGSWGSLRKVVSNEMKGALEAYEKGYSQLEAMQVKTKDVNGWGNFWGFQDEYTALKDLAPELWGEDGVFNVDAAKAFLATTTQLNEEQKKQIQNIIDLKDAHDEANNALEDYLENLYGTWGEDLGSIISDSVLEGVDAWDAFGEKGADVIKRLGQQALYTTFFKDTFDAFTEPLKAAVGDPDEMARQTAELMEALKGDFDAAQGWLKDYYDRAEAMGIDMQSLSGSNRSASRRGYETISEDTGNELNGRATAIQSHTYSIMESGKAIAEDMRMLRSQAGSILSHVMGIHEDTGSMDGKLTRIQSAIEDIRDRGVNIKGV